MLPGRPGHPPLHLGQPHAAHFAELIEDSARPIGVYWILHERDVSVLQPLTNMFFTLLLEHLLRVKGDAETRVALRLDGFRNLGRIPDSRPRLRSPAIAASS
ncbi:MAG TPA: hypothetical protein VMW62_18595 [Chloroflexota bacterium]|nr:hypothetical protein [Chloroflexota bacterium]